MKDTILNDPKDFFNTVDGKSLKSIEELMNYISYCPADSYAYHASPENNHFASWIKGVFILEELSERFRAAKDANAAVGILKEYLNVQQKESGEKDEIDNIAQVAQVQKSSKPEENILFKQRDDSILSDARVSTEAEHAEQKGVQKSALTQDNTPQEHEPSPSPYLESDLDRRLEFFNKYIKDKVERTENTKVAFLKAKLNEITLKIREHRKSGVNMLIPDLLLQTVNPKIEFYAQTENIEDYNKTMKIFDEILSEIDASLSFQSVNIAKEIEEGVRLADSQNPTIKEA